MQSPYHERYKSWDKISISDLAEKNDRYGDREMSKDCSSESWFSEKYYDGEFGVVHRS